MHSLNSCQHRSFCSSQPPTPADGSQLQHWRNIALNPCRWLATAALEKHQHERNIPLTQYACGTVCTYTHQRHHQRVSTGTLNPQHITAHHSPSSVPAAPASSPWAPIQHPQSSAGSTAADPALGPVPPACPTWCPHGLQCTLYRWSC